MKRKLSKYLFNRLNYNPRDILCAINYSHSRDTFTATINLRKSDHVLDK